MTFLAVEDEVVRIESRHPATGHYEPVHVHPRQESRAEVVHGRLTFVVDGTENVVGPGESITIPAGTPHTFANAGDEEAVSVQEFRPGLRIAEFFEFYFDLGARGEVDDRGMPGLLQLAVMVPRFADEMRAVSPPWPVQRIAFALLAPVARVRAVR